MTADLGLIFDESYRGTGLKIAECSSAARPTSAA